MRHNAVCNAEGDLPRKKLRVFPVNYLITINFHGFKEVVEHASAVSEGRRSPVLQQEHRVVLQQLRDINLQPGYQKLSARKRSTSSASAYGLRPAANARQQEFFRA